MTQVTIFRNHDGILRGFECLGHAGYAQKGEDIVCAGISALTITTVNAIEALTSERYSLETDEKTGRIALLLDGEGGHDARLLMEAMILGLESIRSDYGDKFLSLNDREV